MRAIEAARKAIKQSFPGSDIALYRSPAGYYYFGGNDGDDIPSLYWYSMDMGDVPNVVDHINHHFCTTRINEVAAQNLKLDDVIETRLGTFEVNQWGKVTRTRATSPNTVALTVRILDGRTVHMVVKATKMFRKV
jgi:hypothetical protein